MRLINAETLGLEEFTGKDIPPYAILSHTWGPTKSEISFHEFQSLSPEMKDRPGYAKIMNCCTQALRDGLHWAWVDTCCIDKSSSAELSENINSMFNYYKRAKKCYAYLADVDSSNLASSLSEDDATNVDFERCRWFTRGWTLQELLASRIVEFYSQDWTCIGTKKTLSTAISRATRIPVHILGGAYLPLTSVAARMSWAAGREVTRVEDVAYSLLGIFDVHMPLLYGEGQKAFKRLQEEIMKQSDDQSLFAWEYHPNADPLQRQTMQSGLLADSPASFANAAEVVPFRHAKMSESFTSTNKGIRLNLVLLEDQDTALLSEYTAVLECRTAGPFRGPLGLTLKRISTRGNQYTRVLSEEKNPRAISMAEILETIPATLFVVEKHQIPLTTALEGRYVIRIQHNCIHQLTKSFPANGWNKDTSVMATNTEGIGILLFEGPRSHFTLLLDVNHGNSYWGPGEACQIYWKPRTLRKALDPYYGVYETLKVLFKPKTAGPLTDIKVSLTEINTPFPDVMDSVKVSCRKGVVFGHDMYIVQFE